MGCNGSKSAGAAPVAKQQPVEGDFTVTLERTSDEQTLGLRVIDAEQGVLRVEGVKEEGLVPDFIKANESTPDKHVKQGDLIVAVNGVTGETDKLKAEFKAKTIELTIKRVAPAVPMPAAEAAAEPEASSTENKADDAEAAPPAADGDAAPAVDDAPIADVEAAGGLADAAVIEVDVVSEAQPVVEPAAEAAAEDAAIDVTVVDADMQDTQAEDAREARLCSMAIC